MHPGLFVAIYILSAVIAHFTLGIAEGVDAFWPPSGVAWAGLLIAGNRLWSLIATVSVFVIAGETVARGYPLNGTTLLLACLLSAVQVTEALVGAYMVRRFASARSLPIAHPRNVLSFVFFIAPAVTLGAAVVGSAAGVLLNSDFLESSYARTLLSWWLSALLGVVVFTPLLLVWFNPSLRKIDWNLLRRLEASSIILLTTLVSVFAFWNPVSLRPSTFFLLATSLLPLLLWATYRFRMHGATSTIALIAILSAFGTARHFGPFSSADTGESFLKLHAFLAILVGTGLFHAAQLLEKRRMEAAILESRDALEQRVQERTESLRKEIHERVEAERRMRKERDFTHLVLDQISSLFVLLDSEGRILRFNPACERSTGYSPAEVAGRRFWEFLPVADQVGLFHAEFLKAMAGDASPGFESRWVAQDGKLREIIWSYARMREGVEGSAGYVIGTGMDITERKTAEAIAEKAHLRFQNLVESVEGVVWEGDPETLQFSFVSKSAEALLGYPIERWTSEPNFWTEHLYPADRRWAVAYCRRANQERRPQSFEYRMLNADGRIVWIRDIVSVVGENGQAPVLRGIMVDITEQKKIEEALRQSHEQLRMAIGAAGVFPWHWDIANNRINITGVPEADSGDLAKVQRAPVDAVLERIHPDDRERVRNALGECLDRGQPLREEYRFRMNDDSYCWHQTQGEVYKDASGKPAIMAGITADISGRKELEVERARLLEETQKAVQVREEFLSIASHELKTPLTPLKLHLDLLRRSFLEGSLAQIPRHRLAQLFDLSEQQMNRLVALVDGLLDVSRLRASRWKTDTEAVDFADLVAQAIRRLEGQPSTTAEIRTALEKGIIGEWDRLRIEQVVTNLLTNAMKYGRGRPILVKLFRAEDNAILQVRDEGIGIAPEDQQRIFKRFERAVSVSRFSGIGLGLYISNEIVRAHGGSIAIESAPGKGSLFTVQLPLRQAALKAA